MKMVLIVHNEAIGGQVRDALSDVGVEYYTRWTRVLGKGETSGPHLDTHVWPKANDCIAAAVDDESAQKLMDAVRELRKTLGHEGVKAFQLPLEDLT
jgi:nitrogen regulatory protein PII